MRTILCQGINAALLAVLGLSFSPAGALASETPAPTWIASEAVIEPTLKGYGILPVEGETLAGMLERCKRASDRGEASSDGTDPALLRARCDQLKRTLKTQPGNSARSR